MQSVSEVKFSHLSYFVAVAQAKSFSRASEALHLSQPTLSRQIRDLESLLEAELLKREHSGVVLTDAGERLLGHASALLDSRERLIGNVRSAAQNQQPHPDSHKRPSAPITSG